MSENLNRDFSQYEAMTTKELEEILRLDAEAPEGAQSDTELILFTGRMLCSFSAGDSKGETIIEIKVEIGGDRVSLTFSNAISADTSMAESNKIGLKTCAKIAELISSEFSYSVSDDVFTVTVGLISHRE